MRGIKELFKIVFYEIMTVLIAYILCHTATGYISDIIIFKGLIIILALLKTFGVLYFDIIFLNNQIILKSFSIEICFLSFTFLILIMIFSYALDFQMMNAIQNGSFIGIQNISGWRAWLEFFYFSLVTFASIGYGDIVPVTLSSKILVMMEIATSFIVIIFILSNFYALYFKRKAA